MLFEVTADQIERLGDADLRQLVARLCEQEVRAHGLSPSGVTWGGHQNAPDGGIDVRVALANGAAISGYVPAASSGFQVKAQDMARQAILDEMTPKGILRESIADLAANGGAYVIVSSQGSVADTALSERRKAMLDALNGKMLAGSLAVEFYDRTRIATWVNEHPGLIPWVRERVGSPISGWHPFADWSSSPAPVDTKYLLDDGVRLRSSSLEDAGLNATDGLNRLRRILEQPKGIVRLVGFSGVGKTRLVQALFDERIGTDPLPSSDAVYTDISDHPDPVPLELASRFIHLRQRAILIVDNCGPDLHQKLAARITESSAPLSLITVEYDINDDQPEHTSVFRLEAASVDLVEKILESRLPKLAAPSRRVIAEFSGGNARIAFALAATAREGESLANLRDRELFERMFHQTKDKDSNLFNAAKVCALLYSFEGETLSGEEAELPTLAGLAGITTVQLYAHVAELGRRQLAQKRGKWRAILPHAISHRLARIALDDIPFVRIEGTILDGRSERMIRSFSKRIGYLHDDARAKLLVEKWFGDGGLLEPIGKYNDLGKACFTNVAPVDPEATLDFIERAAAQNEWFFSEENYNKSIIVRVLRSIAYDAALFERAATLLKRFAIDPSDSRNDSAKDVFKSLFFLYLSGTHATSAQRAGVIRLLLESTVAAENILGLEALRAMIECVHFSSHYPFEFGARSRDYGLSPRGKGITEWFREVVKLAEVIGLQDSTLGTEVRKIVGGHFAELCARTGAMNELVALAEMFSQRSFWPDGWIGVRATLKRYKNKMPDAERQELETLAARLAPERIADKVRAYAFSRDWGSLEIAVGDDLAKAHQRVLEVCFALGQELARDATLLATILPEAFTADSQKTFNLGKGIARGCASIRGCWDTLSTCFLALSEAQRNARLLSGFAEEAMRRSSHEMDAALDDMLADPRLHRDFVWVQSSAGLLGKGWVRLMAALDIDSVPIGSYMQLAYGGVQAQLDDATLSVLLRKIASKAEGQRIAAEILGMRLIVAEDKMAPVSEILKETGCAILLQVPFDRKWQVHSELGLAQIIAASLTCPDDEGVARTLCERIRASIHSHTIMAWDLHDVISALAKAFPEAVLDILVERENHDDELTARNIFSNMRENRSCLLQDIPEARLLAWASAKPQSRYVNLAQAVKFADGNDDDNSRAFSATAEALIASAPDVVPVLSVFVDRFEPMSWSGSRAAILTSRMPLLQKLLGHTRPEVVAWARAAIPNFAAKIERERAWEASQSRSRDERFE